MHDQVLESATPLMHLHRAHIMSRYQRVCSWPAIMLPLTSGRQSSKMLSALPQQARLAWLPWPSCDKHSLSYSSVGHLGEEPYLNNVAALLVLHQPLQHSVAQLLEGLRGYREGFEMLLLQAGVVDTWVEQPLSVSHAPTSF